MWTKTKAEAMHRWPTDHHPAKSRRELSVKQNSPMASGTTVQNGTAEHLLLERMVLDITNGQFVFSSPDS